MKVKTALVVTVAGAILIGSLFSVAPVWAAKKDATKAQKQAEIRKTVNETLNRLYKLQPTSKGGDREGGGICSVQQLRDEDLLCRRRFRQGDCRQQCDQERNVHEDARGAGRSGHWGEEIQAWFGFFRRKKRSAALSIPAGNWARKRPHQRSTMTRGPVWQAPSPSRRVSGCISSPTTAWRWSSRQKARSITRMTT